MRTRERRGLWIDVSVLVVAELLTSVLTGEASAQVAGAAGFQVPRRVGTPVLRAPGERAAFDAQRLRLPDAGPVAKPFLPTVDFDEYRALKAQAAAAARAPARRRMAPAAPAAPPSQGSASCNGIGQGVAGGLFPPDTHGAVGASHFVHIVNSAVQVYTKALSGSCPSSAPTTATLAAFFGYSAEILFDPRVVYDMTYDRWIVSATAFTQTDDQQFQFVAVSETSDPAGAYFIYSFEQSESNGGLFWDFPQLGYDEEAIIVTGNLFNGNTYTDSQAVFLPKARMYQGLAFSFCSFTLGAEGTVAPPIVLDQSPVTVLATSRVNANRIRLTKFTGTSRVCPTFVETVDLTPTEALSVPADAPQPGTAQVLDTGDGRFVNASTQFGEPPFGDTIRLWQTSTLGTGSATPRFYQINADVGTSAIESECSYFASATSHDFNASIAANLSGSAFITYSSTDPANSINPQVRFTGKTLADACSTLGAPGGVANKTSPNPLTGNFDPTFGTQRWGDYSAVTIDPSMPTRAWAVNEWAKSSAKWKSRFFNMDNP